MLGRRMRRRLKEKRALNTKEEATATTQTTTPPTPYSEDIPVSEASNSLSDLVTSLDTKPELARGGDDFIHASALDGMCARAEVIAYRHNQERYQYPRPCDRIVWALGRTAEKHFRDQVVRAKNHKDILGEWSCDCGSLTYKGEYREHYSNCPRCGSKPSHYGELTLKNNDYKISGNPDFIYFLPSNGKLRVVEIKSMNKKDFDEMTANTLQPKRPHQIQAQIYRRLLELDGYDVDDNITVQYICKDYSFKGSPYHEIVWNSSNKSQEQYIDLLFSKALAIKTLKENPDMPLPEKLDCCSSPTATAAKNCDQCTLCFNLP